MKICWSNLGVRLNDSTKKLEYSMDNLKEFRVVKVSEFYKRFSEGISDISVSYSSSFHNENTPYDLCNAVDSYMSYDLSNDDYFCSARIYTNGTNPDDYFAHTTNVPSDAAFGDSGWGKLNNLKLRDSSRVNRDQVLGCISGRDNGLLRLDFFKINRGMNNE